MAPAPAKEAVAIGATVETLFTAFFSGTAVAVEGRGADDEAKILKRTKKLMCVCERERERERESIRVRISECSREEL